MGLCFALGRLLRHWDSCPAGNPAPWLVFFPQCLWLTWIHASPGPALPMHHAPSSLTAWLPSTQSLGLTMLNSSPKGFSLCSQHPWPCELILSFFPFSPFLCPFKEVLIPACHVSNANTQLIVSRTWMCEKSPRDEKCCDRSSSKLSGLPAEIRPITDKTFFGWKAHLWMKLGEEHAVMLNPKGLLFAPRPWFHL